jgi:hypothetical protein
VAKQPGQSGYDFEELLRAYFLRAGFFVLRGVPVRVLGEDVTDIDIWLYERPTGTLRRRQAVDAKFKAKPKASERVIWARGIQAALALDGVFVATTDRRVSLRTLAKQAGVTLFDGNDLDRMQKSTKILFNDRLSEEQLLSLVRQIDEQRRSRECIDTFDAAKSAVARDFGPASLNVALDAFEYFARSATTSHEGSLAASTLGRLAYLVGSLAAIGLDYVGSLEPFGTLAQRREAILNAIRYGNPSKDVGLERLRLATALARKYASNGAAAAQQIAAGYNSDLEGIPAEIIADNAVKMTGDVTLFGVARALEMAAYSAHPPNFDQLDVPTKSFLGTILDFSDVKRSAFASAWPAAASYSPPPAAPNGSVAEPGDLFSM